jgi:hypothetical protein
MARSEFSLSRVQYVTDGRDCFKARMWARGYECRDGAIRKIGDGIMQRVRP